MKQIKFIGTLVLCLFGFAAHALNVQTLRPKTGYTSGFSLWTSEAQPKKSLTLGFGIDYTRNPLERGTPGDNPRLTGVVDQFFTVDLGISVGLTNRLSVHANVPMNAYHDFADSTVTDSDLSIFDMGDLGFTLHYALFDATKTESGFGLALVPFMTVPTGDEDIFFGDNTVTGGAKLVLDKMLGKNHFYLNVGVNFRGLETLGNLSVNDEFLYGLGFQRPLSSKHSWHVILEGEGTTQLDNFFKEEVHNPLEGHLVIQKKWLDDKLVAFTGGSMGFTAGYGTPDYRIHGGLSYTIIAKKPEPKPLPKPVKPLPKIVLGNIYFPFDRATYYPEHEFDIDQIVKFHKIYPDKEMIIKGHTDNYGTDEYNLRLGERRSEAVYRVLLDKGVNPEKLRIQSYGEELPVETNDTDQGRQLNRRVEIYIIKK